jgi:hypothetical protein
MRGIRMTSTGRMLRTGLDTGLGVTLGIVRTSGSAARQPLQLAGIHPWCPASGSFPTAAAIALILLLSACASKPEATARTPAVCEGLRPDMPIAYHGKTDAPDTILRIRKANARFQAMCS